eukprot:3285867-Rhodomonas_salina.1
MLLMLGAAPPAALAAAAMDLNVSSPVPVSRLNFSTALMCFRRRATALGPRFLQKNPPQEGDVPLSTDETREEVSLRCRRASAPEGNEASTAPVSRQIGSTAFS